MKEEINLLAPYIKTARLNRLFGSRLNSLWIRVVLMMSLFLVLLGVAYGFFMWNQRLSEASLSTSQHEEADTQKKVASTNAFLGLLQAGIKADRQWSNDVFEILKVMPPQVYLTELVGQGSNGVLIVQGTAQNRNDIITFQRNLEKVSWVGYVEAPLKNFATDTSGSFTFTLFPKEKKNI